MPKKILLNCENYETAIQSIEKILGIPQNEVLSYVDSIPEEQILNERLLIDLKRQFNIKRINYNGTIWFHGCRRKSRDKYKNGIKPLKQILPELKKELEEIWHKIPKVNREEQNRSIGVSGSLGLKLYGNSDEGPYGYLIKEHLLIKSTESYDYLKIPEIVDDLIRCTNEYSTFYSEMVEYYKKETQSKIIKFKTDEVSLYHIEIVIRYLAVKKHNIPLDDFFIKTNTCFDSGGYTIPFQDILNIEIIDY